ncbi:TniB family NTP-binding protein [Ralstonia sp.]|uniref:TniB family NTP-binding protein n=1 Tax=Ralstonia sp. TaxID=54061 RepID=UPI0031DC2D6B
MGTRLSTELVQALTHLKMDILLFPRFQRAYEKILDSIELYERAGVAENFQLLGPSGCGKSTLCALLLSKFPKRMEPERTVVPVLYAQVPALATIHALAGSLLKGLNDPAPTKGTTDEKVNRLCLVAKGCGVRLIMLDEVQHVIDRGQSLTITRTADWIKSLESNIEFPIVLVGLSRAKVLLDANEQLRRRFSASLHLDQFDFSKDEDVLEFAGLVASFLEAMPIKCDLKPESYDDLRMLHNATDGRVGYLAKLFMRALMIAYEAHERKIKRSLLTQAFIEAVWSDGVGERNPFSTNFHGRQLIERGEPFYEDVIIKPAVRWQSRNSGGTSANKVPT